MSQTNLLARYELSIIISIKITLMSLWICPLLWRYSSPFSTSRSTVAITTSSRTPPYIPKINHQKDKNKKKETEKLMKVLYVFRL